MMRPAKIQWALGHRRVASGEFSRRSRNALPCGPRGLSALGAGLLAGLLLAADTGQVLVLLRALCRDDYVFRKAEM